MTLRAVEVSNRKHLRDFTRLPARLYESDPVWIPPLPFEREAYFSHRSNPLFKEKRITLWVVYDSGQPVGRISAQSAPPRPVPASATSDASRGSTVPRSSTCCSRRLRSGLMGKVQNGY